MGNVRKNVVKTHVRKRPLYRAFPDIPFPSHALRNPQTSRFTLPLSQEPLRNIMVVPRKTGSGASTMFPRLRDTARSLHSKFTLVGVVQSHHVRLEAGQTPAGRATAPRLGLRRPARRRRRPSARETRSHRPRRPTRPRCRGTEGAQTQSRVCHRRSPTQRLKCRRRLRRPRGGPGRGKRQHEPLKKTSGPGRRPNRWRTSRRVARPSVGRHGGSYERSKLVGPGLSRGARQGCRRQWLRGMEARPVVCRRRARSQPEGACTRRHKQTGRRAMAETKPLTTAYAPGARSLPPTGA